MVSVSSNCNSLGYRSDLDLDEQQVLTADIVTFKPCPPPAKYFLPDDLRVTKVELALQSQNMGFNRAHE